MKRNSLAVLPDLLHGKEQRVYGDSAYASQKALIWGKAPQAKDFTKVRYRGLQKNATRAFTALALANIYLARGRLLGQVRP